MICERNVSIREDDVSSILDYVLEFSTEFREFVGQCRVRGTGAVACDACDLFYVVGNPFELTAQIVVLEHRRPIMAESLDFTEVGKRPLEATANQCKRLVSFRIPIDDFGGKRFIALKNGTDSVLVHRQRDDFEPDRAFTDRDVLRGY